jgi:6-pyruvoyltetrahydropterin/6-carboxytetrahydropterin synthase
VDSLDQGAAPLSFDPALARESGRGRQYTTIPADLLCTRKIEWCSGHRVYGHENKCGNAHGHQYTALFSARRDDSIDNIGRVIDFSVLKEHLGGYVDRNWDHGFLLWERDPLLEAFREEGPLEGHKVFALPYNPTAENIARFLGEVVCPHALRSLGIEVCEVTIFETPNCSAVWQKK